MLTQIILYHHLLVYCLNSIMRKSYSYRLEYLENLLEMFIEIFGDKML